MAKAMEAEIWAETIWDSKFKYFFAHHLAVFNDLFTCDKNLFLKIEYIRIKL